MAKIDLWSTSSLALNPDKNAKSTEQLLTMINQLKKPESSLLLLTFTSRMIKLLVLNLSPKIKIWMLISPMDMKMSASQQLKPTPISKTSSVKSRLNTPNLSMERTSRPSKCWNSKAVNSTTKSSTSIPPPTWQLSSWCTTTQPSKRFCSSTQSTCLPHRNLKNSPKKRRSKILS